MVAGEYKNEMRRRKGNEMSSNRLVRFCTSDLLKTSQNKELMALDVYLNVSEKTPLKILNVRGKGEHGFCFVVVFLCWVAFN